MKKVREGYKLSEKGIVPIEWIIEPFDKCISIKNGQVDPKIEPYCNMPHIGPGNIEKFTGKLSCFNTAKEDMQTSGKYLFDEEDVLYGKINPQLGKVAYPKFKGVCSADMYPLRANKKVLIPLFLKYLLLSQDFFKYSVSVSMRTGMPKINRDELSEYKLLLPMVNEQEKISLILTSVDEQIEITDNLIGKTKELKKGLMQKLLTKGIGHSRFKDTEIGKIPEEWKSVKLSDYVELIHGYQFRKEDIVKEGVPIIKIGQISENGTLDFSNLTYIREERFSEFEQYKIRNGDVLMALSGATTGKVALVEHININIVQNYRVGKLVPIDYKMDKIFLYHVLNSENFYNQLMKLCNTSAQPNFGKQDMDKINIIIPTIEEQKQISLILTSVDEQIYQYESKKEKLQELKKGLMQKLLTGSIRVKV